jgi:hypothetical protein
MNISQAEHGGNGVSVVVVNQSLPAIGPIARPVDLRSQAVKPVAQNHHLPLKFKACVESF